MALSGQLAPSLLATIPGTSRQVRADLLGGVVALRVAFAAHFGRSLVVTDGYRSYEGQVAIFTARNTTTYLPFRPVSIWNGRKWYRKLGTASAAVPGTSNHGWGQALDLGSGVNSSLTSAEYLWMRANAPRFGWTHPAWARRSPTLEPWHWEGVPVAAYALTPLHQSEEDDMPLNAADATLINAVVISVLRSTEAKGIIRDAVLTAVLDESVGTLSQAVRDTRVIARRTEVAVLALPAPGAATINYDAAALAKAVNDDAARRLAT